MCETFVLEPLLDCWWGVASRAGVNQAVIGQANTTILTGSRGSIRFKYDWYFQVSFVFFLLVTYNQISNNNNNKSDYMLQKNITTPGST